MHCLMNVYCEKFTLIFIIKLMKLSLKIEMSHFRVSDIVVTRLVITSFFPQRHRQITKDWDYVKIAVHITLDVSSWWRSPTIMMDVCVCWGLFCWFSPSMEPFRIKLSQGYRNLPFGGVRKGHHRWAKAFVSKGKNEWSCHQRLFEENVRKTKKGVCGFWK